MSLCPTVVLIEDDDAIREVLAEAIEAEGYSVWKYANGREAMLGLARCEKPCLILLDLMMPVMNGWEFLKHRAEINDTIITVPVYIVSAVGKPSDAERLGAQGFIKKPVDLEFLLDLIRKHCNQAAA